MEYGLIGEHLPHSFSKTIHDMIGGYDYSLQEIAPAELDAFMTRRDFKGINVTIPYKQVVIPYLGGMTDRAEKIGAVNTIVNRNGKLYGDNTDFGGMEALCRKAGISFSGRRVLILGSGGTSRTAYAAAKSGGASFVAKVSRSGKDGAVTYEKMYAAYTDAQVIINTTPCGMYPEPYECPVDPAAFPKLSGVLDVIYNPLATQLVLRAGRQGVKASGGLYMLVAQAVLASGVFTGQEIRDEMIEEIYAKLLAQKQNIVLTGMPGSGKTTVGKVLAKRLGRKLIDTDKVIVQEQGCPISEIFEKTGESGFRDLETEVIRRISKETGCIIATGGGAVLREENVDALKSNGTVVFLDRNIHAIVPTATRPLSDSTDKLKKLYHVRYPIYRKAADLHIRVVGNVYHAADDICFALYGKTMNERYEKGILAERLKEARNAKAGGRREKE